VPLAVVVVKGKKKFVGPASPSTLAMSRPARGKEKRRERGNCLPLLPSRSGRRPAGLGMTGRE